MTSSAQDALRRLAEEYERRKAAEKPRLVEGPEGAATQKIRLRDARFRGELSPDNDSERGRGLIYASVQPRVLYASISRTVFQQPWPRVTIEDVGR